MLQIVRQGVTQVITPLAAIVGHSELLQDDGVSDEERRRRAIAIQGAARQIERTMRQLVEAARAEARRDADSQLELF